MIFDQVLYICFKYGKMQLEGGLPSVGGGAGGPERGRVADVRRELDDPRQPVHLLYALGVAGALVAL